MFFRCHNFINTLTLYATFMKHAITSSFVLVFGLTVCNGQTTDERKNNALSLEVGRTGLIYNVTFDRRFKVDDFGVRVDIGSNLSKYLSLFTTGIGGYYLVGKRNSHLELGVDLNYLIVDEVSDDQKGLNLVYPDYSVKTVYPSLNVGYRSYGKRTLFRIGVSPGIIKNDFLPGGYISYGLTF